MWRCIIILPIITKNDFPNVVFFKFDTQISVLVIFKPLTVFALLSFDHPAPVLFQDEESSQPFDRSCPQLPKALLLFQPSPGVAVNENSLLFNSYIQVQNGSDWQCELDVHLTEPVKALRRGFLLHTVTTGWPFCFLLHNYLMIASIHQAF